PANTVMINNGIRCREIRSVVLDCWKRFKDIMGS
ncbi:unnamed protein product, partial [marine sediment metagenome]